MLLVCLTHRQPASLPSRERGLKCNNEHEARAAMVAPLAGAWIEIGEIGLGLGSESLPSRERGLKLISLIFLYRFEEVAPLAGAWIEIILYRDSEFCIAVAPLAGAWIEITLRRSRQ